MTKRKCVLPLCLLFVLTLNAQAGTIYFGTDSTIGGAGVLGIATTNGATVTSLTSVTPADGRQFNGVGEGLGLTGLVTGGWNNEFDTRDLTGKLITQSDNFFSKNVNEDFAGDGTQIWRVVNGPSIYLLNADGTTNQTHTLAGASGLVGLTFARSKLWASDFDTGTVGMVDTTLDTYTPVFSPFGLNLQGVVGGLAFDEGAGVLWIGGGGFLAPFDLAGNRLGPNVDTSGVLPGFIDGVAFIRGVPEPSALLSLLGGGLLLFLGSTYRRRNPAVVS